MRLFLTVCGSWLVSDSWETGQQKEGGRIITNQEPTQLADKTIKAIQEKREQQRLLCCRVKLKSEKKW